MSMQEQVRAATSGINNTPIRNIDPFERKKRIAQQQDRGEFSSRKVTSRKEEAEARRDQGKNYQGAVNPTEYMKMSNQSYYQEFERPKGSFYTQTLHNQQ